MAPVLRNMGEALGRSLEVLQQLSTANVSGFHLEFKKCSGSPIVADKKKLRHLQQKLLGGEGVLE